LRAILRLVPRGRAYPVLHGPLRGARFIFGAAAGEGGGATVYFGLSEPAQLTALQRLLGEGQTFFDVGANVGQHTLVGARSVGPKGIVVAFEPSPRNVELLRRHLSLNALDNVRVVAAACADREGSEPFLTGANPALGRLEETAAAGPAVPHVPTMTVDDFVAREGLVPAVMKIDVEGAEVRVLRGSARTLSAYQPVLLLSTHSADLRATCLALLAEHGYRCDPLGAGDAFEYLCQAGGGG